VPGCEHSNEAVGVVGEKGLMTESWYIFVRRRQDDRSSVGTSFPPKKILKLLGSYLLKRQLVSYYNLSRLELPL
jgi:hypothetical protein